MMRPQENSLSDARSRLLALANERRISLTALSGLIGRNSSYLQQFIRKGSPRKLEENDRRLLAEFFGVAESELGGAEDNSFVRGDSRGSWVDVPRLALGASAGPGSVPFGEQPFDSFRFSRKWLREQNLEAAMLTAIVVEGDSMEPLLRDGDEILVDRTPRPPREGIHVIRQGDVLLVKRIQVGAPGKITLISENQLYPPVEVDLADIEVIGRVVWKAGRL